MKFNFSKIRAMPIGQILSPVARSRAFPRVRALITGAACCPCLHQPRTQPCVLHMCACASPDLGLSRAEHAPLQPRHRAAPRAAAARRALPRCSPHAPCSAHTPGTLKCACAPPPSVPPLALAPCAARARQMLAANASRYRVAWLPVPAFSALPELP